MCRPTIENNADLRAFRKQVASILEEWWEAHRGLLEGIDLGTTPKPIIHDLSEDLLARFRDVSLLDAYDVYEQLMRYWAQTRCRTTSS